VFVNLVMQLAGFIIHIDTHLAALIAQYGLWTYLILFAIVFCETGLVVTPFLPGDSLLFAAGSFAALGSLDIWRLFAVLSAAAIAGDTLNYWIGNYIGPRVFQFEGNRFFNREHLLKTHAFFEKHGGKTIIIARFMPIIRTFAPFVAGVGAMSYWKFIAYNVIGGLLWVAMFCFGGYYFGNIPVVKRNFTVVIFVIIVISLLPMAVEYLRRKLKK
jgi:membrane-associated protein